MNILKMKGNWIIRRIRLWLFKREVRGRRASEDIILAVDEDGFIAESLSISVKKLSEMTKEEIYKLLFKCPYCGKTKTADHLVLLLSQIQVTTENIKDSVIGTVTRKMGICCDECNKKLFPMKVYD